MCETYRKSLFIRDIDGRFQDFGRKSTEQSLSFSDAEILWFLQNF